MHTYFCCSLSIVYKDITLYRSFLQCPVLSTAVYQLSVSTSVCTVLCYYVHCCLMQPVQCLTVLHSLLLYHHDLFCILHSVYILSAPHSVPFYVFVSTAVHFSLSTFWQYLKLYRCLSLWSTLSPVVCLLSDSTSHCTVLCHYFHHCCLL
jgi:hypothetical protein